jgi:competence protein ComEC
MSARFRFLVVGALGLGGGVFYGSTLHLEGTRVAFLSVGQGDCTVFMSDDWVMMVDTGPRTDGFDSGERLIAPQLRAMGVRKIDCLVITHPDLDHVGGLATVADRFRIGRVVVNAAFRNDPEMLDALGRARFSPSQVSWVSGVWKARMGAFDFVVAAPSSFLEPNEGSLFVRADVGDASLLITGDANSETEASMSGAYDWDVDVLKAGHHGSRFSTSAEWLRLTSPSLVVASCGRGNLYGHPAKRVVDRVRDYGADFLRTDRDGTIVVEPRGDDWVVVDRAR